MERQKLMTGDFEKDSSELKSALMIGESFDVVMRTVVSGFGQKCAFFYVTGFMNSVTVHDVIRHCVMQTIAPVTAETLPSTEAVRTRDTELFAQKVLSGMTGILLEGETDGILIDTRKYPLRSVQEPENDKVLRGARDGFGEALLPNTALIRRRIRSPKLTFSVVTVGELTKTDVCVCFMKGKADPTFVENIKSQLSSLKLESVNFQGQTLCEALIKKKWYNPFPKVRYTERPDAAAASLLEGSVVILCDNSPSAMILPTSIFDFFQETDDFCFPPLTGSYLRIIRFAVYVFSIYLTPVWLYLLRYTDRLPEYLKFLALSHEAGIPVFWQLLIVEFAIDGMRLAALNTPDALGSSLSIVGGLILGDFAVSAGWFSPDVILYTAFVTIANFTQTSYELGYAVKFIRMIMLVLVYLIGGYGILLGTLIMILLIVTNSSIKGSRSYLYPLVPFNARALAGLIFRIKDKRNNLKQKERS